MDKKFPTACKWYHWQPPPSDPAETCAIIGPCSDMMSKPTVRPYGTSKIPSKLAGVCRNSRLSPQCLISFRDFSKNVKDVAYHLILNVNKFEPCLIIYNSCMRSVINPEMWIEMAGPWSHQVPSASISSTAPPDPLIKIVEMLRISLT